jgi:hypothetical protein
VTLIDYLLEVHLESTSIIPYVLLANTPQVVVSFLYLSYNGLFTAMLANRELSNYVQKRAALLVTVPSPTQRSTYFLSLPYMYILPLIIARILLRWLISQSLFVAKITVYKNRVLETPDDGYNPEQIPMTDLGYSDSALIATIAWGCVLVAVCLLVAGFCTYPKGMSLGGVSSATISAACHVKYTDGEEVKALDEIVDRPLQWGVMVEGTDDEAGHCCFSDKEVEKPIEGCLYA